MLTDHCLSPSALPLLIVHGVEPEVGPVRHRRVPEVINKQLINN